MPSKKIFQDFEHHNDLKDHHREEERNVQLLGCLRILNGYRWKRSNELVAGRQFFSLSKILVGSKVWNFESSRLSKVQYEMTCDVYTFPSNFPDL